MAIGKVNKNDGKYQVNIRLKGAKPLPVDLLIEYSGGTQKTIHRDVSCWETGNASIMLSIDAAKPIKKLMLGAIHTPAADKSDNVYVATP